MSGTYRGDYADGTETFVLRPDGTFRRWLVRGGRLVYGNTGRWKVGGESDGIDFEHLMVPYDDFGGSAGPILTPNRIGVPVHWLGHEICFNEDTGTCVSRVSWRNDLEASHS